MTDLPSPSDIERLEDNVRSEIRAQNGLGGLNPEDATIRPLAACVATNVDDALRVTSQPRWASPGEGHRWTEEGDGDVQLHVVEWLPCRRIARHARNRPREST